MDWLTEPLGYSFFRTGLAVAVVSGALCGLVGVFVVLRQMSYIGHGLAHAIFGGAVASYMTGINFYLGASAWGFTAALIINDLTRRRRIGADAAIGIVTTASFAVGVALISRSTGFTRSFDAALFGNVLAVTGADLAVVCVVAVLAGAVVFFRYKQLVFTTFDREVAEASGLETGRLDILIALTLAATVVATLQVLGATLVAAALVIAPSVARLLTERFSQMLWLSTGIGAACGAIGMFLSWQFNIASGAAIVLVSAAFFLGVLAATAPRRRSAPRAAS